MLTFLKTLFQKKSAAPAAAAGAKVEVSPARNITAPTNGKPATDHTITVPQVAVARLSLAAILQKLPDDLRANIAKQPDASASIALPVATIQKQLAAGSVKMSLASLYRQAPAGTFTSAKVEEKRMIEVPLSEVLRHVEPQVFRRRSDQRRMDLPSSAPQLFSDRANPFALAPSEGEPEPAPRLAPPVPVSEPPVAPMMTAPAYTLPLRMSPEPTTTPVPPVVREAQGVVRLPLRQLLEAWPEPARAEAAAHPETVLMVPAALLGPCLAKGKVQFTWGQLRNWMTPPLPGRSEAAAETEILLPLKVIAPAFLAQSRPPAAARQEIDLDETIPALFDGGEAAKPVPPATLPAVDLPPPAPEPEPAVEALPFRLAMETPAASSEPEPIAPPAPAPVEQGQRSPQQMIEATAALPGVAGAIVALREGLVVASKLPEHMKGDTVAAFLPQIFARLSCYTQEMQMGEVEDVLLSVNGAHFQGYHMGEIYFAVLGQAGQALPWDELRLVVQELQAQSAA